MNPSEAAALYEHKKTMMILWIIGTLAVLALVGSFVFIVVYLRYVPSANRDLGMMIAVIAIFTGIVTTAIAAISPSPLPSVNSRRTADAAPGATVNVTGTPGTTATASIEQAANDKEKADNG